MPYPNEHAARVKNPNLFEKDSFRRKNIADGVDIIVGKIKGESKLTTQAYRFNKDNFTVAEAKKWLKDHDIKYIDFEPASGKNMNDELRFKNFDISEQKSDDNGNLIITGYGAVFGNIDSYGDIIEKGAFNNTLIERKDRIAFCYQHDIWNPIGKIQSIEEDEIGLKLTVMLSAAEDDIRTKVKEGILKEMSIGYRTINSRKETRNGEDINLLTEIKLIEVSLVTVAANPLAIIESMKGEERIDYIKKEFDRVLSIVRNDNINFEIQKLKSLVLNVAPVDEPLEEEVALSKDELITALIGNKNELLTALRG